ncbi:hypothetical protein PHLCEN_2v2356 [Hermanssonia centrifuga]|uniref:Uncharacterized protein n=1 Tax=Hermanssonia centrifuga TaxID=98765 RepID=A0A2R6RM40_9APHY|nr:hypothetical protein PHLCEN_2v2356 [Hermanssonia centrifuga]
MPTLSRTPPQPAIPSIRLISATPSFANSPHTMSSIAPFSSPLAPRPSPHKRIVPKKSKLGLLASKPKLTTVGKQSTTRAQHKLNSDFSDVVRRVGVPDQGSSAARGGFEIYVDHTEDAELGEIVVVKKKKSRMGLNGMKWGALGEVTNVPQQTQMPKDGKVQNENLLKVKGDENQKWWSIGRGRKDVKENAKTGRDKSKETRSKTPEPAKSLSPNADSRTRFNSLDSGVLLNSSPPRNSSLSSTATLLTVPAGPTEYLAPPPIPGTQANGASGSIAVRAMRSMRSLARMKSWANIGNANLDTKEDNIIDPTTNRTNTLTNTATNTATALTTKTKEGKKKKKVKKEKTLGRYSGSSFEAGALSPQSSPVLLRGAPLPEEPTTKKKYSGKLGLGLPSTLRLTALRNTSSVSLASATASTRGPPPPSAMLTHDNRLSADSAHLTMGTNGRPSSTLSAASSGGSSSLRPPSTASGVSAFGGGRSARSSSSSVVSVRWDEEGLKDVRAMQRRERSEAAATTTRGQKEVAGRESRHSFEGRKRTPISEVFPEIQAGSRGASPKENPLVLLEEATEDGHEKPRNVMDISETPVKRARARPMSEQLLVKTRPKAMTDGSDGVLSLLDAATNDLASLISRLDLEATPGSNTNSPLGPLPSLRESPSFASLGQDSPLKPKNYTSTTSTHDRPLVPHSGELLRDSMASISSLRPYAEAQAYAHAKAQAQLHSTAHSTRQQAMDPTQARMLIGQQIVPWSALDWTHVSPKKPLPAPSSTTNTVRPTHKRTLTPAPALDPPPVFQPLRPAAVKGRISPVVSMASTPPTSSSKKRTAAPNPSSHTFGSSARPCKVGVAASELPTKEIDYDDDDDETAPPTPSPSSPVFKRTSRHARQTSKASSILSALCDTGTPIPPEAMKSLGLAGTMGGDDVSSLAVDVEDPDSDIPDELQVILSGQSSSDDDDEGRPAAASDDDTLSFPPEIPLPGVPLVQTSSADEDHATIPVFRAAVFDEDANEADLEELSSHCAGNGGGGGVSSDEDTKKSFDFTGELQKLNESGGSDRLSFVEQLENAFRTPARVDLGFNIGSDQVFLKPVVPPVPPLPQAHRPTPGGDIVPRSVSLEESSSDSLFNRTSPLSVEEEESYRDSAVLSDTLDHLMAECEEDFCMPYLGMRQHLSLSPGSVRSKASDGQLNTSFRFGGKPRRSVPESVLEEPEAGEEKERPLLTLSDIIPPFSHSRSQQSVSSVSLEGDSSVFKSIFAQAYEDDASVVDSIIAKASDMPPPLVPAVPPRPRLDSDSSSKRQARGVVFDVSKASSHSRHVSEASFTGFDSFDEVRRGFEFGPNRPAFYPPPGATSNRGSHNRNASIFSIASVSSYGAVIHSGSIDPFGYGPASRLMSADEMSVAMSNTVDDTFSFLHRDPRRTRVDSDASSFYFRAGSSHPHRRSTGHRRNESNFSVVSNAPPVSLYNRSFGGHRRNDSSTSMSSVAQSYAVHGANGGRAAWARHRNDPSTDSVMSDFSMVAAAQLGRPGLGDKMFQMDYGMPLSAISGSPADSTSSDQFHQRTTYDSIMDDDQRSTMDDSLFEQTGYKTTVSLDNVFDFDASDPNQERYLRARQFRPVSIISMASAHSAVREDDTMISMLGGGHVRRRSIDSLIGGSPCIRRRNTALQYLGRVLRFDEHDEDLGAHAEPDRLSKVSPDKIILAKPSIASTSSYQFGGERMIMARRGLLERQSLEDSALMAHGEDLLASLQSTRVFSRPGPANRSRSSTVTSGSGAETPPLSSSDGSSVSGGSQSSIDIGHLNSMLTAAILPRSGITSARSSRARARGTGHRRRISQAHASRSSVYETIQEESFVLSSSPSPAKPSVPTSVSKSMCLPISDSVVIVDPETSSIISDWDDEHGIVTLRKYCALRDEAHETVTESKRVWEDTPFSIFAVQSFDPPANRGGMQAMLEHSQKSYGPLPSELRPHRIRSRTSSRASPYPIRPQRSTISPEHSNSSSSSRPFASPDDLLPAPLRQISINPNIAVFSPPPSIEVKPFTPFNVELKTAPKKGKNQLGLPRQRVTSAARRTALGWSKRSVGKTSTSSDKENVDQNMVIT